MKRIAVIGCGAISDSFHLPGLKQIKNEKLDIVLVDPDEGRASALAAKHGVSSHFRSHHDVLDRIDAAVIASPHHTHVPIARDLVTAGIPVLSEKPLGTTVHEVESLMDLAVEQNVVIAVNQTRRFIPACQEIRRVLSDGLLGSDITVVANEGDRFGWPAATPSMFGARSGGKGVLLDIGAHVLDLMVWWFGPDLEVEDYLDDSVGGSEAAARVVLRGPACRITIRLSWLAKQENAYRFQGNDGSLVWNVYDLDEISVGDADLSSARTIRMRGAPRSFADLAPRVIADFLDAIETGSAPAAGPADVLPSMRLIENCYARRKRFDMPWQEFHMETSRV